MSGDAFVLSETVFPERSIRRIEAAKRLPEGILDVWRRATPVNVSDSSRIGIESQNDVKSRKGDVQASVGAFVASYIRIYCLRMCTICLALPHTTNTNLTYG